MPATTTLLNNYDMVLAISENTINNQFYLLLAEGVISPTIDIQYFPGNPALALKATINAPTVDMVLTTPNPNQVTFNVSLASGSFTCHARVRERSPRLRGRLRPAKPCQD